jgi:hypothetical protein
LKRVQRTPLRKVCPDSDRSLPAKHIPAIKIAWVAVEVMCGRTGDFGLAKFHVREANVVFTSFRFQCARRACRSPQSDVITHADSAIAV